MISHNQSLIQLDCRLHLLIIIPVISIEFLKTKLHLAQPKMDPKMDPKNGPKNEPKNGPKIVQDSPQDSKILLKFGP